MDCHEEKELQINFSFLRDFVSLPAGLPAGVRQAGL